MPQVNAPLPRIGNTNPFNGLPLPERITNPFARANMPTQPVIRENVPGISQQPHLDPTDVQRNPPQNQHSNGNPAYNFGE